MVADFRDISDKRNVERETVEYFNGKPHKYDTAVWRKLRNTRRQETPGAYSTYA